jgi:hypothetical protein
VRPLAACSRYLPLFALSLFVSLPGCGEDEGGDGGDGKGGESSSGSGGAPEGGDTASGGTSNGGTANGGTANGGTSSGGASNGGTSSGGTSSGGTNTGGTGGSGATSARSCEQDCADLADTSCAGADFSVETCIPECEQTAQAAIDGAREAGCLEPYLALDACRADDPVCTHPNPSECVEENDAYIQCLEDAI